MISIRVHSRNREEITIPYIPFFGGLALYGSNHNTMNDDCGSHLDGCLGLIEFQEVAEL